MSASLQLGSKCNNSHVVDATPISHEMSEKVELGFVEKVESPEELAGSSFPSKVGGKPVWLDPTALPTPERVACDVCGLQRTFLLQVYAPLEDTPGAFHRTFFLFMCLNPSCHQKNSSRGFRVFRCQLPKHNQFYNDKDSEDEEDCSKEESTIESNCSSGTPSRSSDPAEGEGEAVVVDSLTRLTVTEHCPQPATSVIIPSPLCVVCGSAGPKKCSRCKRVTYCSKHHQTHDWKNGHKLFCSDLASGASIPQEVTHNPSLGICLPEFVLVTEEEPSVEPESQDKKEEEEERGEEERMRDYYKFVESGKYFDHSSSKSGKRTVQSLMEKAESDSISDKVFRAFRKRVALEPEQVIRYQRGGLPLLVSEGGVPQSSEIPPCTCGAKRQFEFQVMPQLLYYLKLDTLSDASVDWGTVVIYSCQASCSGPTADNGWYTEEFVWKQDFTCVAK